MKKWIVNLVIDYVTTMVFIVGWVTWLYYEDLMGKVIQ